MNEPIRFDELGTITVSFDDETYRLTRPKMGQWRYFTRRLQEMYEETRQTIADLSTKVDEATTDKARTEAEAELRTYSLTPFYDSTIVWVREVFVQLGDKPLPDDSDDWPAWLAADTTLPTQILGHWRTHPKASGATSG